ncbi:MAG: tetratricopeptide repeat protein [Chromatiaceae bacterium]|nr:tetratricopeptide repeat protein [Chromatiaceae bacterium]
MKPAGLPLLLTLAMAGCSSTPQPEPPPPTESQSLDRSARLAFLQGQYAQAATLYEAALNEALAEDMPQAIIDARFNLALSQTYLGQYTDALAQLASADAERSRRGLGPDPELALLEATIHYRAQRPDEAQAILDRLLRSAALTPATAAKAHFVAGLIAADRNDAQGIRAHLDALVPDGSPGAAADHFELQGRLAAINGAPDDALRLLDQAVAARSLERDYRGMSRVLAAAGDLAERVGRYASAGDYLLRAGRSAAQREDPQARTWLERARDLGARSGDAALAAEATATLHQLDKGGNPK